MKLLLKLALLSGNCQAVLALLKRGEQVNRPDNKGTSPLMLAASKGHLDLCKLLLEHGANEYWEAPDGKTVRLVAVENGHANIGQLLTQPEQNDNRNQEGESEAIGLETLLSSGEWVEEALDLPPPRQEASFLSQALEQNLVFSRFIPVHDGEDWADIDFELPDSQLLDRSRTRLSGDDIEIVKMAISQAKQAGCINRIYLQDIFEGYQNTEHLVNRLCQVFMAYDIIITDEYPDYWESLFRGHGILDELTHDDNAEQEIFRDFMHAFRDDGQVFYSYYSDVASISSSSRENTTDLIDKRDRSVWELLNLLAKFPEGILNSEPFKIFFEHTREIADEDNPPEEELFFDDLNYFGVKYRNFYYEIKKKCLILNKQFDAQQLFLVLDDISYDIDFVQRFTLSVLTAISNEQNDISAEATQWKNEIEFHINSIIACRRLLVEGNLRLALYFSRKYQHLGCEFSDVIQEANIGLWRASAKFDSSKEAAFATYAVWWIRQSITRYIYNFFNTIRIPVHAQDGAYDRLGHDAHGWEAFVECSKPYEEIPLWLNRDTLIKTNGKDLPLIKVHFDALAEEEQEAILAAYGLDCATPEFEVVRDNMDEQIASLLGTLTEKEKNVLMLRFGIQSSHDHTLEEIGQQFGVTRERIRQIEAKALNKLKHPTRLRTLEVFWNG